MVFDGVWSGEATAWQDTEGTGGDAANRSQDPSWGWSHGEFPEGPEIPQNRFVIDILETHEISVSENCDFRMQKVVKEWKSHKRHWGIA